MRHYKSAKRSTLTASRLLPVLWNMGACSQAREWLARKRVLSARLWGTVPEDWQRWLYHRFAERELLTDKEQFAWWERGEFSYATVRRVFRRYIRMYGVK